MKQKKSAQDAAQQIVKRTASNASAGKRSINDKDAELKPLDKLSVNKQSHSKLLNSQLSLPSL